MRLRLLSFCIALAAFAAGAAAQGNPAVVPLARPEFPWWLERHQAKLVELAQAGPDLIFIGDSILHDFELASTAPRYDFLAVWNRFYGGRRAVNLAFNGDSTANVLWRLENGELAGITPRVAVVLIGTNNTIQGQGAGQAAAGIEAVVEVLHRRLPQAKILLLGILPSGVSPAKSAADAAVNILLAQRYAGSAAVTFLDIGAVLLEDGLPDPEAFMDPRNTPPGPALHPDAFAQARLAAAIEPTLARLLGDQPRAALP